MRKHQIGLLVSLILLLVIAACGSSTSDNTAATPAAATATPAPTAEAAPPDAMKALVEAAEKEGEVIFNGNAQPEYRQAIIEAFQKKYKIKMEYLALSTSEFLTRVDRESKANQVSFDVASAISNAFLMSTRGQVENMKGVVIDPEVLNPAVWEEGYPYFYGGNADSPKDFIVGVQYGKEAEQHVFVNPEIIKPGAIKTLDDLLKPEYKGKISANDPRSPGIGQTTAAAIIYTKGEEYFKKLYIGQKITFTKDVKQEAEWVVRGTYPIALGIFSSVVVEYQKNKLPIERLFPEDGPNTLTGAAGGVVIVKGTPHPNAAKLLTNWLLTKEAQEIYEKYQQKPSMRKDTSTKEFIIDFVKIRPDVKYAYHDQIPDFFFNQKTPLVNKAIELLGGQ